MAYEAKVFNEALVTLLASNYDPTDSIRCAVLDNTVAPTVIQTTPALGDFNEVGNAGTYTLGGVYLGNLEDLISTSSGILTFDSAVNPSWAQDSANDTDAYWGLIYNDTDVAKGAIAYVDLNGPVNMALGTLQITWASTGVFRIYRP